MPHRLPPALVAELTQYRRLAVAFSGGVDSRFLIHAARICNVEVLAIHATGPHIPSQESEAGRAWASASDIPYLEIAYNPLKIPKVAHNGRQRCYYCKKNLLAMILEAVKDYSPASWIFCDGSHAGDATAYRPGLKALEEAGIVSPLARAGLDKAAIRHLARATGMTDPDQRARPCLLTRLAYNLEVGADILIKLAACEAELAMALPDSADFRLRLTPEPILQLTCQDAYNGEELKRIVAEHGFGEAELLPCASVSGFYDRMEVPKDI